MFCVIGKGLDILGGGGQRVSLRKRERGVEYRERALQNTL